jgi:peptide/nickel transport system substrate-binding protein
MTPMRRRRSLAVAAGAAVAALALAACGGGSNSTTAGSPTSGSSSSTTGTTSNAAYNAGVNGIVNPSTKSGGTLSFAQSSVPDSLDPGNTYYGYMWNFSRLYATPLTTFKSSPGPAGNTLVPGLATSMGQVSPDGLVWTYHLKQGLKFSDGEPITSADVKYAVERTYDRSVLANGPNYYPSLLADPTYKGPYKDKTGNLTSITTPDQYTIQFHLLAPFPDMDYLVSIPQTAPVPPGKDTGSNYQLDPVSSGPYMFQSYQLNKQVVLVPNPNWVPSMDTEAKQVNSKITATFNVNADTVDNELLAGTLDVDMAGTGVQAAARAKILSSDSLKAYADDTIIPRLWFIYLDNKVAPLNNLACRQAIEYAANKTDLQTAYGGPVAGGDIASTLLLPGMPGYQAFDLYNAKSQPTGDTTDAKAALAKCGKPNGFTVGAAYRSDRPKEVAAVTALQASLAKVGIQLQLHGYPSGGYYTNFAGAPNYVHQHNLGVDMGGWGPDWPDGYGQMDELINGNTIVATGNTNIGELNDPVVNNLFKSTQKVGLSASQIGSIYGQIDHQAMSDAAILPEVYAKTLLYRGPKLTNAYIIATYGMYNFAVLGTTG